MSGVVSVGVAAVAIGTAVATDFATFAVVAAVGATVGAIGTIAKVPALQIAGAAIGVVGAVGGLASAAGAFGAEGVFGSVNTTQGFTASQALTTASVGQVSESGAQIAGTAQAAAGGAGGSELGAAGWGGGSNVIDMVNGGITPTQSVAAAASSPEIASASAPRIEAASGGEPGANVNGQPVEQLAQTPQSGVAPTESAPGAPLVNAGAAPTPSTNPVTGTTVPVIGAANPSMSGFGSGAMGSSSSWGDIFGFLKDNKALASGAVQAIGSFASGLLNPLTPAQISLMDSQAKANQAAANKANAETDILNMRASNMGQPIPVASRITGRPALGLVNQAAPVTGVPA